jgi:hypothetical protein
MHNQPAPLDNALPNGITPQDRQWSWQLETAIGRLFYESCDGVTQALLLRCDWYLTTVPVLTLVVHCPDEAMYRRALNHVLPVGDRLAQFSLQARLRICSPDDLANLSETGLPPSFEIAVSDLPTYTDLTGQR